MDVKSEFNCVIIIPPSEALGGTAAEEAGSYTLSIAHMTATDPKEYTRISVHMHLQRHPRILGCSDRLRSSRAWQITRMLEYL